MRYLFYVLINIPFDILCYFLNPIVVLFADKDGYLPKWLYWFQTHDHSLDLEPDFIAAKWPLLVDRPEWPNWMRSILKYLRRVTWLYRNTGYAFAYDVLGYDIDGKNLVIYGDNTIGDLHPGKSGYFFCYDKSRSIWTRGWCLYVIYRYGASGHCLRMYLGWKMVAISKNLNREKVMLAMHINPFMRFEE
jgi:hypothetical protein